MMIITTTIMITKIMITIIAKSILTISLYSKMHVLKIKYLLEVVPHGLPNGSDKDLKKVSAGV